MNRQIEKFSLTPNGQFTKTEIILVKDLPYKGHWIDAYGDDAICSCCNRLNHLYGNYCKHCGAKMEDEENGKEED